MFPFTPVPDLSEIKRILIIRQDRLGDLILSLPMASLIKKYHPEIQVDFLVPEYTCVVAKAYQDVNTVYALPENLRKPSVFKEWVKKIKNLNYDLVIVPNTKSVIADLIYQAGIPYRVGQGFRLHGWKYNLPVFQKRKRPDRNELDYNFNMLSRWLDAPPAQEVKFPFELPEAAEIKVRDYLKSHHIEQYSIIHPGSGGSAIDVQPEVLGKLLRNYNLPGTTLVTGTKSEQYLAQIVVSESGGKALDVSGQFSLPELMVLIRGCEIFIGNSTGPLHIARAFERPLLGFYSSIPACHPKRWGPYHQEEKSVLLPPGEQFDTFESDKEKSRRQMAKLKPEDIIPKLNQILKR